MIGRRFFLFGMAATIATARASLAADIIAAASPSPRETVFPRYLSEIIMSGGARRPGRLMLSRGVAGQPVFNVGVAPQNIIRWSARDECEEVIDLGREPLSLALEGAEGEEWDVCLFFRDSRTRYTERHFFPHGRRLMERLSLEA